MPFKTTIGCLSVLAVLSCSQQPTRSGPQIEKAPNPPIRPERGLRIENGINRGIGYTDPLGVDYNIRYIPITIANDGANPIRIQIAFAKEYDYPSPYSDEQFNVIPLPTEWALDGTAVTDSMIDELPKYITNPSINKTLEPGEAFVLAIGTRYRPTDRGILPKVLFIQSEIDDSQLCDNRITPGESTNPESTLVLKLNTHLAGRREPLTCVLIPCGQFSFPDR